MARSQNDAESVICDILELWADQNEDESVPDDLVEQFHDFLDNPVNLNDTSSDLLAALPFVTDFHRAAIRAYIAQNGEMTTLAELYLINGFDSITIKMLRPFVVVRHVDNDHRLSLAEVINHGHSNLRFGYKTYRPTGHGYVTDTYAGSPSRLYFRYYFKYYDRISFQFSGDKDAGEALRFASAADNGGHVGQYGFDYYGYHLMFNNFGSIKRVILGKYNLNFGQGATLWSGSAPWMSGSMPLRRYGQGIVPASAFCEYGYLRGAAATIVLLRNALEMTVFYSDADRDATLSSSDTLLVDEPYFQSFYSSGYHRTTSETAKKGVLVERLFGTRLQYRDTNIQLGLTAVKTSLDAPIVPADYVYNSFAFSGKDNFNAGLDASVLVRRLLFFSEIAVSSRRARYESSLFPLAGVCGMQLRLNSDNMLSASFHYGSPTYQNLHSNIIGQSGRTQNEIGTLLYFSTRLPLRLYLQSSVDFFRFPSMRYRVYAPSSGTDYRLSISKYIASNMHFSCQYRSRTGQRNSDGQLYAVEDVTRRQFQMSFDYNKMPWHLVSKVVYSTFSCQEHDPLWGFVVSQDISYRFMLNDRPLLIGSRVALFDISGYDARVFLYESDMVYEFSVPMLNGRGIRFYTIGRWDVSDAISVALKYALSFYPDNETIGSGYERIDGNHRHEIKMQMRLKF